MALDLRGLEPSGAHDLRETAAIMPVGLVRYHLQHAIRVIDGSSFWQKMRKSLGFERKEIPDDGIATLTRLFGQAEGADLARVLDAGCKEVSRHVLRPGEPLLQAPEGGQVKRAPLSRLMRNTDFGYRQITVERPLRDAAGRVVLGNKGKQKGQPQPDPALRNTETVPLRADVAGLCCTNPMRDSSCESSMVAGWHEQTDTPDLQDQELAGR
jgi:hypothetical protein